jgi:hypothetical protein
MLVLPKVIPVSAAALTPLSLTSPVYAIQTRKSTTFLSLFHSPKERLVLLKELVQLYHRIVLAASLSALDQHSFLVYHCHCFKFDHEKHQPSGLESIHSNNPHTHLLARCYEQTFSILLESIPHGTLPECLLRTDHCMKSIYSYSVSVFQVFQSGVNSITQIPVYRGRYRKATKKINNKISILRINT